MRRALVISLTLSLATAMVLPGAPFPASSAANVQDDSGYSNFSPEELDNLLSPIALYPDPLLSQVLIAATFVDQVDEAARYVRAYGVNGVDDQDWDVAVRAVAHYPTVIAMMSDRIDWTTSVGQAYVSQSTDVMMSIQRLRHMAESLGNLVTTPQQQVIVDGPYIRIDPYQPQYIYVPVYDPAIIYYRRPAWGVAVSFGAGFLIGAWLNSDCDWHDHRVYYHGWNGGGWIARSRPEIHVTNVYVNNRYTVINVNRTVINRQVNVTNINHYNYVHKNVTYNNVQVNNTRKDKNVRPANYPANNYNNNRPAPDNKIIDRNIDRSNPSTNQYRGHDNNPSGNNNRNNGRENPSQNNSGQNNNRGNNRVNDRTSTPPPAPSPPPAQPPRTENRAPMPQPAPAQPPRPEPRTTVQTPPRSAPHSFNPNEGNFDPRVTSQRGNASRQQPAQPKSAPPPPVQAKPQKQAPPPNQAPPKKQGNGRQS